MLEFQKECGLSIIKELVEGDKNLSRIYGFILYTEADPYVAKVLRDQDFWKALDTISGSNWPIFAARPLQQGHERLLGGGPGQIGFLVWGWDEPKANEPIIRDFGIKDSSELPLFVAFFWDDQDDLEEITIHIEGEDIDTVYHSLKEIVETITKAEAAIFPQYKRSANVFKNVQAEIAALNLRHKVIKRGKIALKIAEFLSVFV